MLTVPQTPSVSCIISFQIILYSSLTNIILCWKKPVFHLSWKALSSCTGKRVTSFHGEQCCCVLPNLLSPTFSSWFKGSLSCAFPGISKQSKALSDQNLLILDIFVSCNSHSYTSILSGVFCPSASSSHCIVPVIKHRWSCKLLP